MATGTSNKKITLDKLNPRIRSQAIVNNPGSPIRQVRNRSRADREWAGSRKLEAIKGICAGPPPKNHDDRRPGGWFLGGGYIWDRQIRSSPNQFRFKFRAGASPCSELASANRNLTTQIQRKLRRSLITKRFESLTPSRPDEQGTSYQLLTSSSSSQAPRSFQIPLSLFAGLTSSLQTNSPSVAGRRSPHPPSPQPPSPFSPGRRGKGENSRKPSRKIKPSSPPTSALRKWNPSDPPKLKTAWPRPGAKSTPRRLTNFVSPYFPESQLLKILIRCQIKHLLHKFLRIHPRMIPVDVK